MFCLPHAPLSPFLPQALPLFFCTALWKILKGDPFLPIYKRLLPSRQRTHPNMNPSPNFLLSWCIPLPYITLHPTRIFSLLSVRLQFRFLFPVTPLFSPPPTPVYSFKFIGAPVSFSFAKVSLADIAAVPYHLFLQTVLPNSASSTTASIVIAPPSVSLNTPNCVPPSSAAFFCAEPHYSPSDLTETIYS